MQHAALCLRQERLNIGVDSEADTLESVIVGYPYNFPRSLAPLHVMNETMRETFDFKLLPSRESVVREFEALIKCLLSLGVEVYQPKQLEGVVDQLYVRDLGFVIGDTFVVSRMAKPMRRNEIEGIEHLIERFPSVLRAPEGIFVEGGDIVVDRGTVYVGMSERTTHDAVQFLRASFPNYRVVGVELNLPSGGREWLHLDCAFLPVGQESALIDRAAFKGDPETVLGRWDFIDLSGDEQRSLGTNVLSVSRNCVITRDRSERLNELLRSRGIDVIPLPFDGAPSLGGSFRCCTLPLRRRQAAPPPPTERET
jgi:N-dimethylarginine dimethylaminohydrolase